MFISMVAALLGLRDITVRNCTKPSPFGNSTLVSFPLSATTFPPCESSSNSAWASDRSPLISQIPELVPATPIGEPPGAGGH
jgi:hypothetical protein